MALSFTEKQYWKNRIEKTISGKINDLRSLSATAIDEITTKAGVEVAADLNIQNELELYQNREKEITSLQEMQRELLAIIGVEVYGKDLPFRITLSDINREIERLTEERVDSHFSQHPLGQHLERLEADKAALLDRVLLATNVQQIGDLIDEAERLETLPATSDNRVEDESQLMLSDYSIQ